MPPLNSVTKVVCVWDRPSSAALSHLPDSSGRRTNGADGARGGSAAASEGSGEALPGWQPPAARLCSALMMIEFQLALCRSASVSFSLSLSASSFVRAARPFICFVRFAVAFSAPAFKSASLIVAPALARTLGAPLQASEERTVNWGGVKTRHSRGARVHSYNVY